jgi:hypothetical protein
MFAFRLPKIDLTSMRAAVRNVARRGRPSMRRAMYFASAGSPLLARAIAAEYPVTFCAHVGCDMPIGHDGDHVPAEAAAS